MAFSKGQHFSLAFCNDAFAAVATAAAVAADVLHKMSTQGAHSQWMTEMHNA